MNRLIETMVGNQEISAKEKEQDKNGCNNMHWRGGGGVKQFA